MGHRGSSKRQVVFSPKTDELENSIPHFPRRPSSRPSVSVVASAAQLSDFDRPRHTPLGSLFPLHPGRRPPSSSASDNPQFPLMSAADDDSVGGRALLQEFLTFLDLKGAILPHSVSAILCYTVPVLLTLITEIAN